MRVLWEIKRAHEKAPLACAGSGKQDKAQGPLTLGALREFRNGNCGYELKKAVLVGSAASPL